MSFPLIYACILASDRWTSLNLQGNIMLNYHNFISLGLICTVFKLSL